MRKITVPDSIYVSIVLPTYNRAHFLPEAIEAIQSQTYGNWELIIVDDGSTDETQRELPKLVEKLPQSVTLLRQDNAGPGPARSTGIQAANGTAIAFYDSDDLWHEDHLMQGVSVLTSHSEVDWVYFACRRIDKESQQELCRSTFYTGENPNELFNAATQQDSGVFILNNEEAALLQIESGIDSGLQNSLIRREVLERHPIPDFRIGEDRLLILMALCDGHKMAFLDHVTVTYRVHGENLSSTNANEDDYPRQVAVIESLLASYQATPRLAKLTPSQHQALRRRMSKYYFWNLGWGLHRTQGHRMQAVKAMWRGVKLFPYDPRYWKTLAITLLAPRRGGMSIQHRSN